ncbi:MAG: hypothetical protein WKG00_01215 [Polyangiaceae bacterium]
MIRLSGPVCDVLAMVPAARRVVRAVAFAVAVLTGGCGPPSSPAVTHTGAQPAPPARRSSPGWAYQVDAGPGAAELSIVADIAPGSPAELMVDEGADRFIRELEIEEGGTFVPLVRSDDGALRAPACQARGCRLRYRFLLAEAASAIDDADIAEEHEGVLLAPPSTWLLRPLRPHTRAPFRLRVRTPPGITFVTGLLADPSGEPGAWMADVSDLYEAPFSAFGDLHPQRLVFPGGAIDLVRLPGELQLDDAALARWVGDAARAVTGYYGRFPFPRALVMLRPTRGDRLGYARTLGNGGATILAPLGRETRAGTLDDDWVMTHELVHLAFPNLARQHLWLEEGLATYVEPIARARTGQLSVERVWRGFARGMPNGMPGPDDLGLDRTPTWGRRYWGGAIFCLLADVEIRERTGGTRSLDDALRAIVAAGGNIAVRWPIADALAVGDRATGVPVLAGLYARMGTAPEPVDLTGLWKKLGVVVRGGRVSFDDAAPLAGIRRAITATPVATGSPPLQDAR